MKVLAYTSLARGNLFPMVPILSELRGRGHEIAVRGDELDRPGLRIGVTKGSTSERTLPAKFKQARVVPAEYFHTAIDMLNSGELDVFATNKPTLFEMSDSMPGAHVLPENWGLEHIAIAIPKGREGGLECVRGFVSEVQSNGLLSAARQRAGLRGAVMAAQ